MRRRSGGTTTAGDESTRSPTRISPPSGARKPATRRRVVVLPQPDGPSRATSSPGRTMRSRPTTAPTSPKRLVSPVMVIPGMASAGPARLPATHHVAAEYGLHDHHRDECHREHEDAEDRDGPELALLLQVEDHHRHDLGIGGEQDDRRGQLADHADEHEAPGRDDPAAGERGGDLVEHPEAPGPEDAARLLQLGVDAAEGRLGLRVAD